MTSEVSESKPNGQAVAQRPVPKKAEVKGVNLVHLGTVMITSWGTQDEEGNVSPIEPFRSETKVLKEEFFKKHRQAATAHRRALITGEAVHIGSPCEVTFGILDRDRNVVRQEKTQMTLQVFSVEGFRDLFEAISTNRENLRAQLREANQKAE